MTAHLLPLVLAIVVFAAVFDELVSRRAVRPPERRGVVAVAALVHRLRAPRAASAMARALSVDVPDVCDLLAVAAAAGANVRTALDAVAARHDGPCVALLQRVGARVAGGDRVADALDALLGELPPASSDAVRPLVRVLVDSERYGSPLSAALGRLSADLRLHRQHRAQERARRVPVRLLLPLVTCVLPAFALLTVVPLLAGIARGALADLPPPSIPLETSKDHP